MKGGAELLKTGQVAKLLGVSRATLGNWEHRDILLPDCITPTGRRLYSEEKIHKFMEDIKYVNN